MFERPHDLHDPTAKAVTFPDQEPIRKLALTLRDRLRRALALAGDAIGPDFAMSGHVVSEDYGPGRRLAWSATRETIEIRLVHDCRAVGRRMPPPELILRDDWPKQQQWLN